jgi:hypothetical protein
MHDPTEIKLPEPTILPNTYFVGPVTFKVAYYSEAQLKQALIDVLEQAAKVCDPWCATDLYSDMWDKATEACAEIIRAMKEQIK